jgi:hypothetical protein
VLVDVGADERADGIDAETAGARVVEDRARQPAPDTVALERFVDLGVVEHDAAGAGPARLEPVRHEAGELVVEIGLVAIARLGVDDAEI